jgi:hypothetical protein
MRASSFFALLTLTLSASASPTLTQPAKRACTTQYPSSLGFPINYTITTTQPAIASFEVPANAVGPCSLLVEFPAGYPVTYTGPHDPEVNVVALTGLSAGSVVGTTTFASRPDAPVSVTINSFVCETVMEYRLEIASWETGSVAFQEELGAGLILTYNC